MKKNNLNIPFNEEEMRFAFGKNWSNYLNKVDEAVILEAERHLKEWLQVDDFSNLRFADLGCGSGLFSLAAYRLGAGVYSLDLDSSSVACAEKLNKQFYDKQNTDNHWDIKQGSVLDIALIEEIGKFDIVYSWGVLHHTGSMWRAIEQAALLVAPNGQLFISIYNNQGIISKYWSNVKLLYNKNIILRLLIIIFHAPYLIGLRFLSRLIRGVPIERGMSLWHDMLDWLGGFPFETASPEQTFKFLHERGFNLQRLKTVGGKNGCNEFVFVRGNEK